MVAMMTSLLPSACRDKEMEHEGGRSIVKQWKLPVSQEASALNV